MSEPHRNEDALVRMLEEWEPFSWASSSEPIQAGNGASECQSIRDVRIEQTCRGRPSCFLELLGMVARKITPHFKNIQGIGPNDSSDHRIHGAEGKQDCHPIRHSRSFKQLWMRSKPNGYGAIG